ncbi:hypothetical protein CYMTET_45218 [Cymbomonas tetramitiformis]|uniref:Uncharacterized protein n=1 Tax=Cymbomonas tetramitiformis TaxID=36881 RepID=A0AAE0C0Q6_9CHLO|nr:hypothetical protein CYMTET_45218 [Cymbomonas tetramitiformis]
MDWRFEIQLANSMFACFCFTEIIFADIPGSSSSFRAAARFLRSHRLACALWLLANALHLCSHLEYYVPHVRHTQVLRMIALALQNIPQPFAVFRFLQDAICTIFGVSFTLSCTCSTTVMILWMGCSKGHTALWKRAISTTVITWCLITTVFWTLLGITAPMAAGGPPRCAWRSLW